MGFKLRIEHAVANFEEQIRIGMRANFIYHLVEGRYHTLQGGGKLARTTEDCTCQLLAEVCGVGAGKEGTHAVAKEK